MSEENHRIWGAGVGGWGATKARRLIYRGKFWVDSANQIWKNCYEWEVEEESSRWWEQLQQSYVNWSMHGHVGQPTNYNLMNEVDETERNASRRHWYRRTNETAQQFSFVQPHCHSTLHVYIYRETPQLFAYSLPLETIIRLHFRLSSFLLCGELQKHMHFETGRSRSSKVIDFGTNQKRA